jgi:HSP20 family molecular chaperone IbpA
MLEEPFSAQTMGPLRYRGRPFDHPFLREGALRPSVDLTEQGNAYVVEAELPGVKKENIEVNVGDNGQSVTIQGRIQHRSTQPAETVKAVEKDNVAPSPGTEEGSDNHISTVDAAESLTASQATPLTTERFFSGDASFTRTVWLPREVDQSKVTAKLEDGILTLRLPKADEKGSLKINVE